MSHGANPTYSKNKSVFFRDTVQAYTPFTRSSWLNELARRAMVISMLIRRVGGL